MSDSVCRVNSPKPWDGGNTQHKHKPKGRRTRAKPLHSTATHTHQGGMRAAAKAKTQQETTGDNFTERKCAVGKQQKGKKKGGGGDEKRDRSGGREDYSANLD